jgi:hypothetical protein
MNRRFAGVGVRIRATRLQEIAAGAPVVDDEMTDISFALAATGLVRERRQAKFERNRRRGIQWLIVAGMIIVVLNLLLCMAFVLFSLAQHALPY